MPNYRRLLVPGGDYFFTVNLIGRRSTLLTDEIDTLRSAYAYVSMRLGRIATVFAQADLVS